MSRTLTFHAGYDVSREASRRRRTSWPMTGAHQPGLAWLTSGRNGGPTVTGVSPFGAACGCPSPASRVRPVTVVGPGNSPVHPRPNLAKANSCVNQLFSGCVFHVGRCCRGTGPAGTPQRPPIAAKGRMRLAGPQPHARPRQYAVTAVDTARRPLRPGYSRSCMCNPSRPVSYRLTTQEQRCRRKLNTDPGAASEF